MHVIIVTDIFGRTGHFDTLCRALVADDATLKIIDPYDGISRDFLNEEQAYQAFLTDCGHSDYGDQVSAELDAICGDIVIVGFSAGASAAWKAIDKTCGGKIRHFLGFYPSQIRNNLDVVPPCPVTLIFPRQEDHFDVEEVIDALVDLKAVDCIKTDLHHGFMNPMSRNYAEEDAKAIGAALGQVCKAGDAAFLHQLLRR